MMAAAIRPRGLARKFRRLSHSIVQPPPDAAITVYTIQPAWGLATFESSWSSVTTPGVDQSYRSRLHENTTGDMRISHPPPGLIPKDAAVEHKPGLGDVAFPPGDPMLGVEFVHPLGVAEAVEDAGALGCVGAGGVAATWHAVMVGRLNAPPAADAVRPRWVGRTETGPWRFPWLGLRDRTAAPS